MARRPLAWMLSLATLPVTVAAPLTAQVPSIAEKTRGLTRHDGFIPFYWDSATGRLWLEIPSARLGSELLYITGAVTGLGSNDIGLDRGQIGGEHVVRFRRIGNKVLMIEPNYGFRSSNEEPAVRRSVEESFAFSTLWGFRIEAESGGNLLVDGTDFAVRDVHDAVGALARARQGTYRLDASRSTVYPENTRAFPRNTEIEVLLTLTGESPGNWVRDVAPTPGALTLWERISFVALPDSGYTPRRFDPRAGFFGISWVDETAPLGTPMLQQFIARHRLRKRDPRAQVSEAVQPIVYYLDRGAPEPIRSALLEGARWWNQAFEAAGYRNAFRVELLPEGVSSMDISYNVINWVHRSTRGWSSGATVIDPRTGEIIKAVVTLGSLRVRQDWMIAEGLLQPYRNGDEATPEIRAWALQRMRQLAAHEVGHTLGLGHNYYDSDAGRISVMDYPHPLVTLRPDGSIDHSQAYADGIGEWDKVAIAYGYQDFPDGTNEDEALQRILDQAWTRDLRYMTNQDLGAHARVNQWSNGTNAAAELGRMLDVRRAALSRFGENAIRRGMPMAQIEEVLVPLYLHHRYQVDAAANVVGGMHYAYAMRGDNREPVRMASATEQRAALAALVGAISPATLALPPDLLKKIPPRPSGYGRTRELFPRYTGLMFDAVSPAVAAADLVASALLAPDRAARLVEQKAIDPSLPGLEEVIDALLAGSFGAATRSAYEEEVRRAVERVVVDELMELAGSAPMSQVRAIATLKLQRRAAELGQVAGRSSGSEGDVAQAVLVAADIQRFLTRPANPVGTRFPAPVAPPGAPIGEPAMEWLRWLEPDCTWWEWGTWNRGQS